MHSSCYNLLLSLAILTAITARAQVTERFISHATYLSSDELEGRGPGTAGSLLAAEYIQSKFREIGLEFPYESGYFQEFFQSESGVTERNVVGILSATSSTEKSVVFTAHFDAYGIVQEEGAEDVIYNGARDNAIGVAALIELARMYVNSGRLNQNLVFVATAAEEDGLVGSRYYTQHPVFALKEITIVANIDGFNVSGPRDDFFVMPRQGVDFVDEIVAEAKSRGWTYSPPDWVDTMNTNFDTATFLLLGVPAFTIWTGNSIPEGVHITEPEFGSIHSPEDEINDTWDWSGVGAQLDLYKSITDYFLTNPGMISVQDPELFRKE